MRIERKFLKLYNDLLMYRTGRLQVATLSVRLNAIVRQLFKPLSLRVSLYLVVMSSGDRPILHSKSLYIQVNINIHFAICLSLFSVCSEKQEIKKN